MTDLRAGKRQRGLRQHSLSEEMSSRLSSLGYITYSCLSKSESGDPEGREVLRLQKETRALQQLQLVEKIDQG